VVKLAKVRFKEMKPVPVFLEKSIKNVVEKVVVK